MKALRYFINVARGTQNASITLLDENAFTIFSTDEEYQPTSIDRFYDKSSNLTDFVLNQSLFYYEYQVHFTRHLHVVNDLSNLCNYKNTNGVIMSAVNVPMKILMGSLLML